MTNVTRAKDKGGRRRKGGEEEKREEEESWVGVVFSKWFLFSLSFLF